MLGRILTAGATNGGGGIAGGGGAVVHIFER